MPLSGQALINRSHVGPIPGPMRRATTDPSRMTILSIDEYCGDPGYFGGLNSSVASIPGTRLKTSSGSPSSPAQTVMLAPGPPRWRSSPKASWTVAEVTCFKDEVRVASPVVRASHDGLRLVFHDAGDLFGAAQLHHETWEAGTAENMSLHGRVTKATSAIAPGKVTIVCLRGRHGSYDDPRGRCCTRMGNMAQANRVVRRV